MSNEKEIETDQAEAEKRKAECRGNCKGCICCRFCKEKKIINKYLDAIEEEPEHFSEEAPQENLDCQHLPFRSPRTTQIKVIIKDIRGDRIFSRNKLDYYEKIYRCYVESYKAKTNRRITFVAIIAIAIVLCVTVALCAYGPNFKSQENVNTPSYTVVVCEHKDCVADGYTYFQEIANESR